MIDGVGSEALALGFPSERFSARKQRFYSSPARGASRIELLSDELLFLVLEKLADDPLDLKSVALASRTLYLAEAQHRRLLRPLRVDLLPAALRRYSSVERLDLTHCLRVGDPVLLAIAGAGARATLRSIDLSRSFGFTNKGLEAIAMNCRALTSLDLSNATEMTDGGAAAVAKMWRLEELWFVRCKAVTDMGLGCVAVGCPNLSVLSLKWCLGVTDLAVGLFAVKCKNLRVLDLSYTLITGKCLPGVMQLQHLEELALIGCHGIGDKAFTTLKQGSKSLKVLNVSWCDNVGDRGALSILDLNPALSQLNLSYCSITCPIPSNYGMVGLRAINFGGCMMTSPGLKSIGSSCMSLTELSLSKCSGLTDEGLSFVLSRLRYLAKLDITCCRGITSTSLETITTSCPSLVSLLMESCSMICRKAFCIVGQCCNLLEELDLTDNDLDDDGVKAISACHKLSSLKLGLCLNVTDEGLTHLANSCPVLRELDLYRSSRISDFAVNKISGGCPLLQMVNLSYCTNITDDSLVSLANCMELNTLEIRGCFQVTSLGVSAIASRCRKLATLDIKRCYNVDDAAMLLLGRYSQSLRRINLSYCSITDIGLLALLSSSFIQYIDIQHLAGITPNGLAAALLVCTGLIEVKISIAFHFKMSQPVIEVIEARGCALCWIDKPFKIELEPSELWNQRSKGVLCL